MTSTEQVIERLRPWLQHTLSCVSQRDLHNDTQCRCGLTEAAEALSRNTPVDSEVERVCGDCGQRHDPDIRCPNFHAGMHPASLPPKPVDGEVAELVERLRDAARAYAGMLHAQHAFDCRRAADMLLALSRTEPMVTDALCEALRPFADFADVHGYVPDEHKITVGSAMAKRQLTMGDCRKARAALSAGEKGTDDALPRT